MSLTYEEKVNESVEVADEVCTEWEINFLAHMVEKIAEGWPLSDLEHEKIDEVYDKVCKSPF